MPDILTPGDVAAIRARYDAACAMSDRLCLPRHDPEHRDWLMSIPARPDHDPDLVIGRALADVPKLLAALDAATAVVAAARAIPAARIAALLGWPPAGYDLGEAEVALVEALVAGGYLMTAEEARR